MKLLLQTVFLLTVLAAPAYSADLRHPSSLNSFCVDPEREDLCALFPDDQTDFSDKFVYMFINVETQTPFDVFSWQAFVSLNWPETGRAGTDPNTPWTSYRRREEIFGNDLATQHCGDAVGNADVVTANLVQADGNSLIDQNGNFIVYETRVNSVAETYVYEEALNTLAGQIENNESPVAFPQGRIGDDPTPASVLVKTSWQVMTQDTDQSQYVVKNGLIFVPASHSASGKDMCVEEKLGLVGMHIVSRIHSGNGDEWLWSTFEHRNTVPTAGNFRRVNAIFSKDLFPGGCSAPADATEASYIFFDPECPDCPTNKAPAANLLWADKQPYAKVADATAFSSSQIVRCWEIFEGTAELNELWQAEMSGTSLANYNLISTQWRGADKSPMFEHGEVPRFLTNTTMETYLQADDEGTCLGCHASALSAAGTDGNFTFLLENAK